jgi:hypothetical protein
MSPSVLRARSLAGFLGRVAAFVTQEVYLRVVFLRGVTCVATFWKPGAGACD